MQNLGTNCQPTPLALEPSVWFFAGQVDDSPIVRRVSLETIPFRVGRRTDLPLTLPCRSVSKEHAEIFERDNCLWIRDLNSTNGTYVNGTRVFAPVRLTEDDIVQFATVVFRVGRDQSRTVDNPTVCEDACDQALSLMQFDRLLDGEAVIPFFQPIVKLTEPESLLVAYEVLGRSRIMGLTTPHEMFATASQLSLETELSRVMRKRGIEIARRFETPQSLYVNTHPRELGDDELIPSLKAIRTKYPDQPLVLEIHESSITNPKMIRELRDQLVDLDVGLAFDDFGAGQARLVELAEVRPDCIKLDMKLVQGIATSPQRQEVVTMLVKMVNDLGITSLAEGVETIEDDEVLRQMGVELGQGYLYGRPAPITTFVDRKKKD